MRTSALAPFVPGLAVLGFFAVGNLAFAADTPTPGMEPAAVVVNHQAVSRDEFLWFAEQERAGVIAFFKGRYNLEYGPDYWERKVGGTTPRAVLQQKTIERLLREKVEQSLFQELGLVQDIRYAAFLQQLEKSNRDREQAAKQGKVVYGPTRYSQLQFYGHWKATLRAQATEKLAQQRWPATEELLRQFYADNRTLFRAPPSATLEVVTVQTSRIPPLNNRAEPVQSVARKLLSQLKAGGALPDLLHDRSEEDAVKVSWRRLEELNADRLSELFPDEGQIKQVLALAPKDSALLTDSDTQARVVRCVGKVLGTDRPYEAVRAQVKERWLSQRYERHLADLAGQAQLQINQAVIDALSR